MIGVINRAEHNLFADPPEVIPLGANAVVEVLPNEQNKPTAEIAYRYVQNVGANPCFYSIGSVVNVGSYHGVIYPGGQLDVSNHRLLVSCVSIAGTTVSTTTIRRKP